MVILTFIRDGGGGGGSKSLLKVVYEVMKQCICLYGKYY